ncbi:MAG: aldolase/citrate lyase family protein [Acidobacteriota bacterium]
MTRSIEVTERGVGEAGRFGEGVRSDLHVRVEIREEGGLQIELTSRVAPYYRDSIQTQARGVMEELGVAHARLDIHDEGALPYVIAARIEAAVRRAGALHDGPALPQKRVGARSSDRDQLRRSRLYLPGNEPKFLVNAGLHGPDCVILDLEDSVHPKEKDAARILVRNALRWLDFGQAERMVRINPVPLGLRDLEEVVPQEPDLILIPKTENAGQVTQIEAQIREIQSPIGKEKVIWLMPILESALGIENAFSIASACGSISGLTLGVEDYAADLGVTRSGGGSETFYARTRLINAARAAGVQAIDSVFSDVMDMEGLGRWAEASRQLGFEGMGCIHPRQIPVIHEAFSPSRDEIERALCVVTAFEAAEKQGLGVVSLGSRMIDPPVVRRALQLVKRARALKLLDQESGKEGEPA